MRVQIGVYNINGLCVKRLVDGKQDAGINTIRWDPANIPSGVYFYRIEAGILMIVRNAFM